jgi:hypothetical protein
MDNEDWERLEMLVEQAGQVANDPSEDVPHVVRADAMSFHTLGLAILDLHKKLCAKDDKRIIAYNGV